MKWLWSIIWRRWLWNDFDQAYYRVVKVKSWNSALVESKSGNRLTLMPIWIRWGELWRHYGS